MDLYLTILRKLKSFKSAKKKNLNFEEEKSVFAIYTDADTIIVHHTSDKRHDATGDPDLLSDPDH